MKLKNIKCYKSTRSGLTVLALRGTIGLVIAAGEDFEMDKVYFNYYSFRDKSAWIKLNKGEARRVYEDYLRKQPIWGGEWNL